MALIWKCGGVTAGRLVFGTSSFRGDLRSRQFSLLHGLDVRLDNLSAWLWCDGEWRNRTAANVLSIVQPFLLVL